MSALSALIVGAGLTFAFFFLLVPPIGAAWAFAVTLFLVGLIAKLVLPSWKDMLLAYAGLPFGAGLYFLLSIFKVV